MTTIQIKGTRYHTHDVLSCGDYSRNGMVGISNVEVLLENHSDKSLDVWNDLLTQDEDDLDPQEIEIILVRGNWSSRCVYIREDLFLEYSQKLDHYILLDEDDHSNREYEQARKDWADYGAKEFLCELKKKAIALYNDDPDLEIFLDGAYEPDREFLWKLYHENSNYGSCYEGSSTHFYIEETLEEIAKLDFFLDLLACAKEHAKARQEQASEMEAVLFE